MYKQLSPPLGIQAAWGEEGVGGRPSASTTILQCIAIWHNGFYYNDHNVVLLQLCPVSRFLSATKVSSLTHMKSVKRPLAERTLMFSEELRWSELHFYTSSGMWHFQEHPWHLKPLAFEVVSVMTAPPTRSSKAVLPVTPTEVDNAKWNETKKVSEAVYKNGTFIATERSCTWRHRITTDGKQAMAYSELCFSSWRNSSTQPVWTLLQIRNTPKNMKKIEALSHTLKTKCNCFIFFFFLSLLSFFPFFHFLNCCSYVYSRKKFPHCDGQLKKRRSYHTISSR